RLGIPEDIPAWHEVLNTDAARYGGSDIHNPHLRAHDGGLRLTLPPLATIWLRPT
ncbi:alpha amylase C-terminal domain-containing protein, partial [Streptomyces mirabilis]|uniref:alpha amylase C-terminal domain-containing protein n=1 Tax=Streptomyces mirabilis TaxID=68239 RepID=UPI0033304DB4